MAIVAGASYFLIPHDAVAQGPRAAMKASGVGLLALWTLLRIGNTSGRSIALVLALGAVGDALIEIVGLTAAALAFLAGHLVAIWFYLNHRRATPAFALPVALAIAVAAWLLPTDRRMAMGVALYAFALGAMTGTAFISRYPRALVGVGTLLFAVSDLLLFAQLGPLRHSPLPGVLIWPLYFTGQLLIAVGVVESETAEGP